MALTAMRGKKREKKKVRAGKRTLDEKYLGPEPDWGDNEPTKDEYRRAYGWYNYMYNGKEHAKAVRLHFKKDKAKTKLLNKLPDWRLASPTMGTIVTLIKNGNRVPEDSMEYFNGMIKDILEIAKTTVVEQKKEAKTKRPTKTIQERTREIVGGHIAELEGILDQLYDSKDYKFEFDMYAWLGKNNVKPNNASAIREYYMPLHTEVELMFEGLDKDLNEGYDHLKPAVKRRYFKFMNEWMSDLARYSDNVKKIKKTRSKKPVTLEKRVKDVKYKETDDEFKLASVSPTEIIGAQALWVFDTKNRELSVYRAKDPMVGLLVKGTTLEDWSDKSEKRKLRKPEEVLPKILKGGKRDLSKLMDTLTTTARTPNARINSNMILLRTEK